MKKLRNFYTRDLNKTAFWLCLLISITLIVSSFIVPPTGVIDGSVLAATGEIFSFAALGTVITALERNKTIKMSKGDTNISVGDEEPIE